MWTLAAFLLLPQTHAAELEHQLTWVLSVRGQLMRRDELHGADNAALEVE